MTKTDGATFCATLVDEWVRAGVTAAFVAPGSRSTPLALALAADERMAIHLFHDERVASFAALGHALATDQPAIVLCTSGTAATHFHASVMEADLSSVPLIVCTADRPPELWDVGAPQTMDQTHLYGSAVRYYFEPGVPDAVTASSWRSLASRMVAEARGWSGRAGPVHANLSFRDPLVGEPAELPTGRADGRPWHDVHREAAPSSSQQATSDALAAIAETLVDDGRARRGAIVAGAGTDDPGAVDRLATLLGWPVLADHRSGCRQGGADISHFDAMLRNGRFAAAATPEIILRFGEPLSSKVLGQWIGSPGPEVISIVNGTRWSDPERVAARVVGASGVAAALCSLLPAGLRATDDGRRWRLANEQAAKCISAELDRADETGPNDIDITRDVIASVPAGGALVVSSSMPIRDVEWYGPARPDIDVFANRGANGIDGVVSTAIGVALSGRSTTLLIGDVAFLHDGTALIGLAERGRKLGLDLHVVVIDNDGGGIFSFLPQATLLDDSTYELLFGTPHNTDLAALARAHNLAVTPWTPKAQRQSTTESGAGVRLSIAHTDRAANVALHERINRAVIDNVEW